MCCMHVVFLCLIFVLYENVLAYVLFVLYDGCKKNTEKKITCCSFPCLERALVFCVIYFPRVERPLKLLCCIFRVWNALWHYCVILSYVWNALWHYCVIFFAPGTRSGVLCYIFSARGTRSGVIVLYFPRVERAMALLCDTFLRVECALALLCYIFRAWNALWRYCVIFFVRGTRSGIFC